jgi:hypothetical protein
MKTQLHSIQFITFRLISTISAIYKKVERRSEFIRTNYLKSKKFDFMHSVAH